MLNFIRILSFLFVALLLACEPAEESQKSDIDRQDVCADQQCSGHGSCQAAAELESGFRCVCDAGWEGVDCENLSSDGDDDDDSGDDDDDDSGDDDDDDDSGDDDDDDD
ncbi:MAG: hypothetical protein CMH60_07355, partial [Myxococcales bacterium]|nr:hypothetical protein [Myxococcales bacterium]